MEDTQASFQILRLSVAQRMIFLLLTLNPSIARTAAQDLDSPTEWALAFIVAGE